MITFKFNEITTLESANTYVTNKYGSNSKLEELLINGKLRYKFVGISCIKNFPYPFKSIITAMNCLFAHERGIVGWEKREKAKHQTQLHF